MTASLRQLYVQQFGATPAVVALPGGGSNRRFYRLAAAGAPSVIGIDSPDVDENRAFFSFTRTFRRLDLPVPEVFRVAPDQRAWIEQDLGDTTLYEALLWERRQDAGAFPERLDGVFRRALEHLLRFQIEGGLEIDFGAAYPRAAFDAQAIQWDLSSFKYHFLQLAHVPFHEGRLEQDFACLAEHLLDDDTDHFQYRDFQARNIMLVEGEPWFIDYQGGRRGALHYDVASLLYSPKLGLSDERRAAWLDHYLDGLEAAASVDRDAFRQRFRAYVLVRILQAMGAYGYRGFYERKQHFLRSVAPAIANLEGLLDGGFVAVELPELRSVIERICQTPALRESLDAPELGLVLHVSSFSYKRGYPRDRGGHGGGFVFDCRALPNPGREAAYRGLSGLDAPVADYLREAEGVDAFLQHALDLVGRQLETYLARGFSSLSVGFGCTGGQHRSVYLAERLAEHVRARFPAVTLDCRHTQAEHWPDGATRPDGIAADAP
jgi:aminoglycoside/choline kinase family phosphotransferase